MTKEKEIKKKSKVIVCVCGFNEVEKEGDKCQKCQGVDFALKKGHHINY